MFKTQVEPRAAGEWFHCQVLNIWWRHFYGPYKSVDKAKVWSIRFLQNFSGIYFIFRHEIVKTKSAPALRCKSRHFHGLYNRA